MKCSPSPYISKAHTSPRAVLPLPLVEGRESLEKIKIFFYKSSSLISPLPTGEGLGVRGYTKLISERNQKLISERK
jgi:hypothetical protein